MTAQERQEIARAALALDALVKQLVDMTEPARPVPAGNVQATAYLLNLTAERMSRLAGNVQADNPGA